MEREGNAEIVVRSTNWMLVIAVDAAITSPVPRERGAKGGLVQESHPIG